MLKDPHLRLARLLQNSLLNALGMRTGTKSEGTKTYFHTTCTVSDCFRSQNPRGFRKTQIDWASSTNTTFFFLWKYNYNWKQKLLQQIQKCYMIKKLHCKWLWDWTHKIPNSCFDFTVTWKLELHLHNSLKTEVGWLEWLFFFGLWTLCPNVSVSSS